MDSTVSGLASGEAQLDSSLLVRECKKLYVQRALKQKKE